MDLFLMWLVCGSLNENAELQQKAFHIYLRGPPWNPIAWNQAEARQRGWGKFRPRSGQGWQQRLWLNPSPFQAYVGLLESLLETELARIWVDSKKLLQLRKGEGNKCALILRRPLIASLATWDTTWAAPLGLASSFVPGHLHPKSGVHWEH